MMPDLNLLLVFDALMLEQHVGRAARRLHRSQPAVSQALARLRDLFGDPLFTRHARGLTATARAKQLWAEIQPPLQRLNDSLSPQTFDPANARLNLTFGAAEDVELLLLPELMAELRQKAPDARFDVQPTDWQVVDDDLLRGKFDIAFTIAPDGPAGIRRESLMVTGFSCLYDPVEVTPPNPALNWYLGSEHVIVTFSDARPTFISDYFRSIGRQRLRAVSTRNILATPYYVAGSKAVATMPTPLATLFAAQFGLATIPLPLTAWQIDYSMLWPQRRAADRSFQWVLDEIRRWALLREGQATA